MNSLKFKQKNILITVLVFISALIYFLTSHDKKKEAVVISMPYSSFIRNIDNNYYKTWLEEKTGLSIKFEFIPDIYKEDYINNMFLSGNSEIDAFFSFIEGDNIYLTNTMLQEYGKKGYIIPLNDYIDNSVHFKNVLDDFNDYNLKTLLTSPDGNIYYLPGLDPSKSKRIGQVMWMNHSWLSELYLPIPKSTDELYTVLSNFSKDQNRIPFSGCKDSFSMQSYNFIINAFVYNDPINYRMYAENGTVKFAPLSDQWREAVKYLNKLYSEGLLHRFQFTQYKQTFTGLANDPRELLGSFTSSSITEVLYQNSPEIISNFIHIPPIIGPLGKSHALAITPLPKPNGVITSSCKNPEAVFKLLDLMLSEEAFLIGRYGEEGVDWERAEPWDIDMYGNQAKIRIKNNLRNKLQNKHLLETGPFYAYPEYADSITWSGFQADQEYINARAYRIYEHYIPETYIKTIMFRGYNSGKLYETLQKVNEYTNVELEAFITGDKNPNDDSVWSKYIQKYYDWNINKLILAVQKNYELLK